MIRENQQLQQKGQYQRQQQRQRNDNDSDNEDGFIGNTPKPKSFDDLFSEASDTTKKGNEETPTVVFNKDSDDESEKGHADVDDLMGGSDDEKSRNGDNGWDLEDV